MSHGIRNLNESDLANLLSWESLCFPGEEWTEKMMRTHLEFHPGFVLEDANPVAYSLVCETPWEIEIFRIASLPQFRNLGFASTLIRELISKFPTKDFFLEVKESNSIAYKLYRKLNFEELERRKNYYPDGSTAILMKRKFTE
ncbi:GNAT family N-acetyltransferase [Leptospira sp. 96542]|nr:GNAT family N-acetyltransferase [Leptospira sp. 96542]